MSRHVRLGIAARLTLSFVAVAVLAVAANLLAEQGVSVVQTTRTIAVPRAEPPPVAPTVPLPEAAPAAKPAPVPSPVHRREVLSVTSDVLVAAINGFERAAQGRSEANTAESGVQLQLSGEALDKATGEYLEQVAALTGIRPRRLAPDIRAYRAQAEDLVRNADAQRAANAQYAEHFEAMNGRMKTSLDGAWKIFGRVVARQSLMRLRTDLDDLRRDYAAFSAGEGSAGAEAALKASEDAFAATLKQEEKGYQRSEGAPWVEQMRSDFDALLTLRGQLVELRARHEVDARRLAEAGSALLAGIPKRVLAPAPERIVRAASPEPAPAAARVAAPLPAQPAPSPALVVESRTLPAESGRMSVVAWITAAVLLVLLAISVLTILSVVRPVNRMLKATGALARGDRHARVPRGGVRELDTLAVAFNDMADKLAVAQASASNYQQQLEMKVEERTRQLQDLAERDPLTRLPNRRQLFALLHEAIAQAANAGRGVGVFFLDVDNFKNLNDSLGHAYGDRVLVAIAERLQEMAQEVGMAGRLGGDEFTVVLGAAGSTEAVQVAGEKLVAAFQRPVSVDGREVVVNVSVGASVYPQHGRYAEELLTAADAALYRAKALGRNQLALYTPELLAAAANKFTTEQRLRGAIERGELELLYQPEISVESAEVELLEALIRWRMPDGQLLLPGDFLAVAEESGLITEISDWVLRTAIAAAARWHHGAWPEVRVAINVSSRQMLDPRFVGRVQELLRAAALPARCIELELTETVLQTAPGTVETLGRLRALGVAVALDDFGTGYSSLASLEALPLTRIKLDRAVIGGIDRSPRAAAIAGAIIRLCSGLGLDVTAEGVERIEQVTCLRGHRNMALQGFLLSGPVLEEEVLTVLSSVARRTRELLASPVAETYGGNVVEITSVA